MKYTPFQTATGITKYLSLDDMSSKQRAEWNHLSLAFRGFIRNQLHVNWRK